MIEIAAITVVASAVLINPKFKSYIRGDIIGFLVGDYHYDDMVYYDDIPIILTGNAVMYDKKFEKLTDTVLNIFGPERKANGRLKKCICKCLYR